ncbi:MAG TPA: c-type cytochrome [Nitriliruptorales bacterium]|nr:c-type cytochrome [Nitriliruptorales bacterium]
MRDGRLDRWSLTTVTLLLLALAALVLHGRTPDAGAQEQEEGREEVQREPLKPRPEADPKRIFDRDCAVCHGTDGRGGSRGPSLKDVGEASVHFYLTTGYMPIRHPDEGLRRREPVYTEAEIDALVEYVGGFITGPHVPDVEVEETKVEKGGEVFRLNCAQCHQFIGTGGIVVGSNEAPALHQTSAVEVVEAIRIGPGTMPKFSEEQISEEDAQAVASFIALEVQEPTDDGGFSLGRFGPFSEGLVSWVVGMGALLVAAGWIGKRT